MRQRLRRLREPRYVIGAIVGFGYLAGSLLFRFRAFGGGGGRQSSAGRAAAASTLGLMGPVMGAVLLAFALLGIWALPMRSGLLEFSKAETAFLFPSPMSRRQLVFYRLMRSQFAVFAGALIMSLAYPTGSVFARTRWLVGIWILLMTSHVFFTGVTLARVQFRGRGGTARFAWPALALPAAAVLSVLVPVFTQSRHASIDTISDALNLLMTIAEHGPARVLLRPFALLVQPVFAQTVGEFAWSVAGALLVYAVAVAWLIWADSLSVDAADASVERQVNQPTNKRRAYVARPVAWRLGISGRPELAFVWKAALQTLRAVDRRMLVRVLLIGAWMVGASLLVTRARGLVQLFGVLATWGALFSLFMAPQMIRMDMRQDLAALELLKTWPVRGASVIRGEIIWPVIVVTSITWAFAASATVLSMVSGSPIPYANRAAAWVSFLILIPGIVLAQYTIHNAVAVIFPGWVPLGAMRPRGVDAVGQRLVLLAANWLGLLVALAPGVAMTFVLSLLLRPILGRLFLPVGALVTTITVVVEMVLVTTALGPVFERLDITSVERPD